MGKSKLHRSDVLNIRAAKPGVCPACGREKPYIKNLSRYHMVSTSTIQRVRRGEIHKKVK